MPKVYSWEYLTSDEILKDVNDLLNETWKELSITAQKAIENNDCGSELKYLIKYCEKRNITSLTDRKIRVILKRRRKRIKSIMENINNHV